MYKSVDVHFHNTAQPQTAFMDHVPIQSNIDVPHESSFADHQS